MFHRVLNLPHIKNIQSTLKLTVTLFVKSGKKEIELEYTCIEDEDQVLEFFFFFWKSNLKWLFFDILSKLHMLDIHALAGGGVSRGIQGLILVNCIVL